MATVAYTKIGHGKDVQKKMIEGAIELAEAVVFTLGPSGYTVSIDRTNNDPLVTKDGVTVARHIKLGNAVKNQGAQILKQVANRAQSQSGDGTTTAILLAMEVLKQVLDFPTDINSSVVKEGMKAAEKDLVNFLNADSVQIDLETEKGLKILEQVAYISANNDSMIAGLINEAIHHSKGKNPIKINKGRTHESYVETLDGMIYYNTVHHDYFLEALNATNELLWKNARLFFTDHEVNSLKDLSHIMEFTYRSAQEKDKSFPLVIVAPEFSKAALHALFYNIDQLGLKIIAVKAPEFGIQQSYCLHDMAIYTNARAILKNEFESLQDMEDLDPDEILGSGEFHVKRDQYAIINGEHTQEALDKRINYLDELIAEEESGYMQDQLVQRKAKLMGSVSIIFIGAETPVEADEIYDRVDDAVNAVKGAIAEGVVKGGGVAFLESIKKIAKLRYHDREHQDKSKDFHLGYKAVMKACERPFSKIIENAEKNPKDYLKIVYDTDFKKMYNLRTDMVVDIFHEMIFDPKKITVNSLKSAISVVVTLLNTNVTITNYVGEPEN